jgi:hypothetical protein
LESERNQFALVLQTMVESPLSHARMINTMMVLGLTETLWFGGGG